MSTHCRRYELLLPLEFNDGSRVPDELIAQTLRELRQQFGAVSDEAKPIEGHTQVLAQVNRDRSVRLFADVADLPENRAFFVSYKEELKSRFRQDDIWITSHPIEVL
jgi:hypothetical protein